MLYFFKIYILLFFIFPRDYEPELYFSELRAFPLKLFPARADSQFWQSFSDAV